MSLLTNRVKQEAFSLGADLVGVANIERYEHAPIMMSPQGILPEAKSVVVMALHHPDGCIEMGGEPHPQVVGPYAVQYTMNAMLDEISFKMGRFLQDLGFRTVPIVSSNIWRYRGYEGLRENFAPDVSHMHAAVAAGLADFGFSGLALTPEYGARNRFVQVITTAELAPTPLLEPGSLCDDCGLCKKHCPSAALVKEIDGWNEVPIEDKVYRYANKNLWRCAWGEHFDLDLDLEIPDRVTEKVILEKMEAHGIRGGEFGCCLRFCLPKAIRSFDKAYSRAPRRMNRVIPPAARPDRKVLEQIPALSAAYGCADVRLFGPPELRGLGIDAAVYLPDAISLAVPFVRTDEEHPRLQAAARQKCDFSAYRIARLLEDAGYSVVSHSSLTEEVRDQLREAVGTSYLQTIFTSADLPFVPPGDAAAMFTMPDGNPKEAIHALAHDRGIDLFGISSIDRLNRTADQLERVYDGRSTLTATDRNHRFKPFDPEITEEPMRIQRPEDIMDQARSIIVLGQGYPVTSAERAGQPPARTVGPYVFARYEAQFLLSRAALDICTQLQTMGHRAAISFDPLGLGGKVGSVRGELYDHFACRFAAAAAGAAVLSKSGYAISEKFGPHQVFMAIITDAALAEDPVSSFDPCENCEKCIDACTDCAFTDEVTIAVDGRSFAFRDRDLRRCDWSKRYALTADSGFGVMGSELDIPAPEEVNAENLAHALKQHDPITKYRPSVAEKCVLACPVGNITGARK